MTWTWKLNLPAISKHTRDNLGLIIAVLAAVSAVVSGYEAHMARVHADDAANKTIKLQSDAVEAQKEATQLDERPYINVNVVPSDTMFEHRLDKDGKMKLFLRTRLTVLTSGRMPATDVSLGWECDEELPVTGPRRLSKNLRSGDEDLPKEKIVKFAYLTTSGTERPTPAFCEQDISQGREQNPVVFILGLFNYRDYFGKDHPNKFCLEGQFPQKASSDNRPQPPVDPIRDAAKFQFTQCPNFTSTFK
jgi:hypothetical protein